MGPGERVTPADRRRFAVMRELGCLLSRVYFGRPGTPGEVHHLLEGGRRRGHQATVYLHPWFHRGEPPLIRVGGELRQLTVTEASARFGPSLAVSPIEFRNRFGRDDELLEIQDQLIEAWTRNSQLARGAA